ncbi:uncharacterized protein LOC123302419 [Chrysoperla carnea]|uniref:uncharacterized protein LOC123302419 n=1 Tax=Chrysoperla carnea TaxID=189513 RepID=UPI001D08C0BE|nr:uncharacterized protein LOC123302419 [Chrysoperla carnea]
MAFVKSIVVLLAVIVCAKAVPFVYLRDNGAQIFQPLLPSIPVSYYSNVLTGASVLQYPVATSTLISSYPSVIQYGVQQPIIANNGYNTNQITNNQIAPVEINLPANC